MPMERLPPAGRSTSRFAPTYRANETLESVFQSSADLRGPLSTIPDGMQARDKSSGDGPEEVAYTSCRETDAVSAVPWNSYFDSAEDVRVDTRDAVFRVYRAGQAGPVLLCLHGGGYTGLTWAPLAARVKQSCRVVAVDLRGHGETTTADDAQLSAEVLTQDVIAVWQQLLGAESPPTVLVGHSMGGAVAVRAAASKEISSLEGLVVIDVVEGTALAALPHMQTVLQNRPPSFPSLTAALAWAHRSGMSRSMEAAAVSLPSQLKRETAVSRERWVWRTVLGPSAPFWQGWYRGLSELFLSVKVPKVLMLAGTDRLDKTLTIGQMQGKFQMVLLPQAGHAVHEDEAERTAEVLLAFLHRFRVGTAVGKAPRPSSAGC